MPQKAPKQFQYPRKVSSFVNETKIIAPAANPIAQPKTDMDTFPSIQPIQEPTGVTNPAAAVNSRIFTILIPLFLSGAPIPIPSGIL